MERFKLKTAISFGTDALAALEELAGGRVMVVTDDFLAKSGLLDKVKARLPGCTVETFTGVVPDPPLEVVAKGARALADFKPRAVVAFGGGSALDCAKAMVEYGKKLGAPGEIAFWAVPTTAGTGSEVTSFAVLTDSEKGVKYPLVDDALLPHQAVLDPVFLAGVPAKVTADTGMDVLTHAAEAYVAAGANVYTDALAEKAFVLAWKSLPAAFGGNQEAKADMLLASNLAGMAFNAAGLGLSHSLAHALGGRFHIPHGRLNAMLLPHVIRFNAVRRETAERYAALAKACGLTPTARGLVFAIERLRGRLEQPGRLSECGVEAKQVKACGDEIAAAALADLCAPSNPRPVTPQDIKAILRELA